MSIKKKTVSGSFWNVARTLASNLIDFSVYVILARILTLEEFGLLAFCLLIIELANIFTNVGVNQNLIQREKWDDSYASSTFVFVAIMALVVSSLVAIFGGGVAYFYHSTEAFYIVLILSLIPFSVGLQSVFSAKLERDFKNKRITVIRTSSSLIAGLVTILLALNGAGIWSLVFGKIFQNLLVLFIFKIYAEFKPSFSIQRAHVLSLIQFCLPLLWIAILNFLNRKGSNLVTGGVLGVETFALISVAKKGQDVLNQTTITPINKMVVPAISRVKSENRVQAFYKLLMTTGVLVIPAFLGLGAVSHDFITVAFGEKFAQSAVFLTITSSMIVGSILGWFLPNMLIAVAQTKAAFKLSLLTTLATFGTALATIWFGVEAMLISIAIIHYAIIPFRINIVKQYYDLSIRKMIVAIMPATISSLVMVVAIKLLQNFAIYDFDSGYVLAFSVVTGVVTYIVTFLVFFFKDFKQFTQELKSLKSS